MPQQAGVEIGRIPVVAQPWEIIPSGEVVATKEIEVGLERAPIAPPAEPPAPLPPGVMIPYVPHEVPEKKGLIINIETNGFRPWEHRIIAIGLQNPMVPSENPTVIMLADEKSMVEALFNLIKENGYNELIGYGLSFDYRFLLIKAMKYGIDCKEFYDMELYDLMQAVAQGKFSFVYKPQSPPSLSNLADYLWGYPKPFTDLEMMKYYALGQFDKVIEFTSGQITRILALYYLFRKVSETEFIMTVSGSDLLGASPSTPNDGSTESLLTIPEAHLPETWLATCPVDLSQHNVPITQSEFTCPIDGTIIKRA